MKHPRDKYLTVFGRKPVIEALENPDIQIEKILITLSNKGPEIDRILNIAASRNIELIRTSATEVSRISKHPKQDQGIAADVITPNTMDIMDYLNAKQIHDECLFAIDSITTPANLGLIIRTATAMGIDGILLPRKGTAKINAFVIKASAGSIFKSTILKCEKLKPALKNLKQSGFRIYALSGEKGTNIYEATWDGPSVFILGNESTGVSSSLEDIIDAHLSIPMKSEVESLNVACAAAVVASEVIRKKSY